MSNVFGIIPEAFPGGGGGGDGNYVTVDTAQDITGAKRFLADISVTQDALLNGITFEDASGDTLNVAGDATFTGTVAFNNITTPPHCSAVPQEPNDLCNKQYVDSQSARSAYQLFFNRSENITTPPPASNFYRLLSSNQVIFPVTQPWSISAVGYQLVGSFFNTLSALNLEGTSIPAGVWTLLMYANVNTTADQAHVGFRFLIIGYNSVGAETILYTSPESSLISVLAPNVGVSTVAATVPSTSLAGFTGIGVQLYLASNTNATRTGNIFFQQQDSYSSILTSYAYIQPPNILNTANQWTAPQNFQAETVFDSSGIFTGNDAQTSVNSAGLEVVFDDTTGNSSISLINSSGIDYVSGGTEPDYFSITTQGADCLRLSTTNITAYETILSTGTSGLLATTQTGTYTANVKVNPYNTVATTGGQIAVGSSSGNTSQGNASVAIGVNAGQFSQGTGSIAIGNGAGVGASGAGIKTNSIAIGTGAGSGNLGQGTIAIGNLAGQGANGNNAVAIGLSAGQTGLGLNSVVIGPLAAQNGTNSGAICIGLSAGQGTTSAIGSNSIAIGSNAGLQSQVTNSICLNASGTTVNPSQASLYVRPIRAVTSTTAYRVLFYDASTSTTGSEVVSNTTSNPITFSTEVTTGGNVVLAPRTVASLEASTTSVVSYVQLDTRAGIVAPSAVLTYTAGMIGYTYTQAGLRGDFNVVSGTIYSMQTSNSNGVTLPAGVYSVTLYVTLQPPNATGQVQFTTTGLSTNGDSSTTLTYVGGTGAISISGTFNITTATTNARVIGGITRTMISPGATYYQLLNMTYSSFTTMSCLNSQCNFQATRIA
jgi:hypothetical protein